MSLPFKAAATTGNLNGAFLSKLVDDETIGVLGLKDTANPNSGDIIDNSQRYINEIADSDGTAGEGDVTRKVYSTTNIIADGDNRKVALGKLDTQVKTNIDAIAVNAVDIQAIEDSVGVANGIAELDATGRLPVDQLPTDAMVYRGTWDASTNTPTLIDGTGTSGDKYLVSVAGTQDLGSGSVTYGVNDALLYSGAIWEKLNNTNSVVSVNGEVGIVVLDADDIAESTSRYWDVKNNRTAIIDPTVSNDSTENYAIGSKWFNTVSGIEFILQDATAAAAVWIEATGTGGGGAGSFSYIDNSGAEDDTAGWVVYANTVSGTKPDDFGGVPNVGFTWTRNTTTPLFKTADFLLTKPALNVSGHGVYYPFTAENGHLTSNLLFSALAKTSLLDDGDLSIWLASSSDSWVSTNRIISANNPGVRAGLNQIFKQLQLDATDLDYRLCFHYASTDAVAKTANFDEIKFGPSPVASGAVMLDQVDYTPGYNTLTYTTQDTKYSRQGEFLVVEGVVFGVVSSPAATAAISIPTGFKIATSVPTNTLLGEMTISNASAANNDFRLRKVAADQDFVYISPVNHPTNSPLSNINWNDPIIGGDDLTFKFKVKIEGWSSNASSSIDLGQRLITMEGDNNAGTALTANVTDIDWISTKDSVSAWSGTSFLAPESGTYRLSGSVRCTTTISEVALYINGAVDKTIGFRNPVTTSQAHFFVETEVSAGDVLSIRSATSITLLGSLASHYIAITKVASPQTVLETESVYASFASGNGQTVLNGNSIDWEVTHSDSHAKYSAGLYNIPVSGFYKIEVLVRDDTTASSTYQLSTTDLGTISWFRQSIGSLDDSIFFAVGRYLEKDDAVRLQNVSGASRTLSSAAVENTFTIARIK